MSARSAGAVPAPIIELLCADYLRPSAPRAADCIARALVIARDEGVELTAPQLREALRRFVRLNRRATILARNGLAAAAAFDRRESVSTRRARPARASTTPDRNAATAASASGRA